MFFAVNWNSLPFDLYFEFSEIILFRNDVAVSMNCFLIMGYCTVLLLKTKFQNKQKNSDFPNKSWTFFFHLKVQGDHIHIMFCLEFSWIFFLIFLIYFVARLKTGFFHLYQYFPGTFLNFFDAVLLLSWYFSYTFSYCSWYFPGTS